MGESSHYPIVMPPPIPINVDFDERSLKIMNCKLIELQQMVSIFGKEFDMKIARDYLKKIGYNVSKSFLEQNFQNGIFTLIQT